MPKISELAAEIASAIEIYFLGRGTQHYNNATFILCDDYTELASKLFLIKHVSDWQDKDAERMADYLLAKQNVEAAATSPQMVDALSLQIYQRGEPRGRFKNYHLILTEVDAQYTASSGANIAAIQRLHTDMKTRRETRNNLVHTSGPLGMQASSANCIEALCDLLSYVELLFGNEWQEAATRARKLETYTCLLLLEREVQANPSIRLSVDGIFEQRRRQNTAANKIGAETVRYGHDVYTYLSIWLDADHTLKTALQALHTQVCGGTSTP